jgi:hypothetical protein
MLFVGEAPPASGRFFYQADSGLYRAIREAFVDACPDTGEVDFLKSFQELGCYLVDLCDKPVDGMDAEHRRKACLKSEARLARILKQLQPKIVITVVRSIVDNVRRSALKVGWSGLHLDLPYPGRWHHHRTRFLGTLTASLRETMSESGDFHLQAAAAVNSDSTVEPNSERSPELGYSVRSKQVSHAGIRCSPSESSSIRTGLSVQDEREEAVLTTQTLSETAQAVSDGWRSLRRTSGPQTSLE